MVLKMADEKLLITAVRAALQAGEAIMDVYQTDFAVEQKKDNSPLTLADKRAHEIIVGHLSAFDIPVLSEEGRDIPYKERKDWQTLWIVDPLDGTKEFIRRNGEFTVNIALVHNNRPVMGVVFVPDRDTLYVAAQDLGSYKLEDKNILQRLAADPKDADGSPSLDDIVSQAAGLPLARSKTRPFTIMGSRSHMSKEVEDFVAEKRREYGEVTFISAGSSLKLCLVAQGAADIYPRLGPTMEWDVAAAHMIAQSAGATVLRYDNGQGLMYNKEDLLNPWFVVSRA
jgi:3'(2'), 5'-bisphosphate nucleotidase